MMWKAFKPIIIYLSIIFPIMMFYMISAFNGICTFYDGVAVDSDKNLYLGKGSVIQVFSPSGEEIRNLSSMTSRGYSFTITEDNLILLDTGSDVYTMDIYGNIIQKSDSTGESIFSKYRYTNKYSYITSDGTQYIMKNILFRTKICKVMNGKYEQVYIMPIYDFIVKMSFILCIVSALTVLPFLIIKSRKIYSSSHQQ